MSSCGEIGPKKSVAHGVITDGKYKNGKLTVVFGKNWRGTQVFINDEEVQSITELEITVKPCQKTQIKIVMFEDDC